MKPPRYIVWSTDKIEPSNSFQHRWYIRQVLLHGRAEDIRTLNLKEVAQLLNDLPLPIHIRRLWENFLKVKGYATG